MATRSNYDLMWDQEQLPDFTKDQNRRDWKSRTAISEHVFAWQGNPNQFTMGYLAAPFMWTQKLDGWEFQRLMISHGCRSRLT